MRRYLICILSLVLLIGCSKTSPLTADQIAHKARVDHLAESTVVLLKLNVKEKEYVTMCSGVWITQTKILTARHCAEAMLENENSDPVNIHELPGVLMPFLLHSEMKEDVKWTGESKPALPHFAVIVGYGPSTDLVLLEAIESLPHDIATVSLQPIWDGMPVHVMGHPVGMRYSYFPGVVASSYREMDPFGEYWRLVQISAPIAGGNSGGGVFNNQGELIGISSFMKTRADCMAFFIHRSSIRKFLFDENVIQ